jgi:hypothetical protein
MRKSIKLIGLLLVLVGLLSVVGMVATRVHAAPLQSSCVGALVASASGTECLPPGTHGVALSRVTRICNTYQYPVNFLGNSGIYVIYAGQCQTFNGEDGTIYVDM